MRRGGQVLKAKVIRVSTEKNFRDAGSPAGAEWYVFNSFASSARHQNILLIFQLPGRQFPRLNHYSVNSFPIRL